MVYPVVHTDKVPRPEPKPRKASFVPSLQELPTPEEPLHFPLRNPARLRQDLQALQRGLASYTSPVGVGSHLSTLSLYLQDAQQLVQHIRIFKAGRHYPVELLGQKLAAPDAMASQGFGEWVGVGDAAFLESCPTEQGELRVT
ncbi:hypothetical protein MC885_010151 [Smutsia gigantea]|nr:hypothetical protein MC885_010151 [Smutsia gigantea]